VFAARIAEDIGALKLPTAQPSKKTRAAHLMIEVVGLEAALRHSVAQHMGVMRNHVGLVSSLKKIVQIQKQAKTLSSKNMATSCLLIAAVALGDQVSRTIEPVPCLPSINSCANAAFDKGKTRGVSTEIVPFLTASKRRWACNCTASFVSV
jgi:hypothetical protein